MTTTQERPSLAASLQAVLGRTRDYAAFFVALALAQLLYGVVFWSAATDISAVRREVNESYDYELVCRCMTHEQYASLYNQCGEPLEDHEFAPPYLRRFIILCRLSPAASRRRQPGTAAIFAKQICSERSEQTLPE